MKVVIVLLAVVMLVSFCVVTFRHPGVPRSSLPLSVAAAVPYSSPQALRPRPIPRSVMVEAPEALRSTPVDIRGPLRNRHWVERVVPDYPEWAEEQGVTGTVAYKIWVNPEGSVRSLIQMVKSSGEPRFDEETLKALRGWKADAIANATGDQWGLVTFHYDLDSEPSPLARNDRPLDPWHAPDPGLVRLSLAR